MAGVQGISLEPESFIQGGLINDVDVEVTDIVFTGWDYDGRINEDVLAVKATLCVLDDHGRPDPNAVVDQYWSAGGAFNLVGLSDDGYTVFPGPNKTAFTKGSNLELLLVSLRAKGMPKGYLDDGNIGRLKGVRMHVIRQAVKREGMPGRGAQDKESQTLVCTNIISAPWEKGGARKAQAQPRAAAAQATHTNGAPAAPATNGAPPPPAAAAAVSDDVDARAAQSVTLALSEVTGNMFASVKDLKVAVFRKHAKEKADVRNQIVKLVEDVAWLEAHGFSVMDGAVIGAA